VKVISYSFRDLDKEAWTLLENQAKHLSVFQTYSWARVLSSQGIEPRFLMLMDKGSPLLGLLMSKTFVLLDGLCGYQVIRGPLFTSKTDESVYSMLVSALKSMIKERSVLLFSWEPCIYINMEPYVMPHGFLRIPSATFVVDLSPSIETLWRNLEGRARNAIRKAEGRGVNVTEATDWSDWEKYYDLYQVESYRKHRPVTSLDFHKSIYGFLVQEEKAKLFIAKHDGEVVGGVIFLLTPHEMVAYEAMPEAKRKHLSHQSAIHWCAISWAKNRGIKYYDLRGALCEPDKKHYQYGIHTFKRQWGGKLYRYHTFVGGSKLFKFCVIGRNLTFKSPKIRHLSDNLKRLGIQGF